MANVINATSTGNGGLVSTGDDSGILNIQTNETTAITVDASQNVGIGTTSPSYKLHLVSTNTSGNTGTIFLTSPSTDGTQFRLNNTSASGHSYTFYSTGSANGPGAGCLGIYDETAGAYRTVIDSSGNLLLGTTSANIGFTTGAKSLCFNSDYGGSYPVAINHSASGNGYFLGFGRGGSQCGYIWTNGSNSTQYVTSSDYRLKENIVPMTGALAKVSALKPVTYTWKEDGTSSQGCIAHELQEIVPEAVAGDKDALNEDGSIKPQGIDTSFLVATLTAAIQELKAINDTQAETINALTARIVALESK